MQVFVLHIKRLRMCIRVSSHALRTSTRSVHACMCASFGCKVQHAHTHTHACTCICACMQHMRNTHKHMYIGTCTCSHAHEKGIVHMYAHSHTRTHAHAYAHACSYAQHTQTHVYRHPQAKGIVNMHIFRRHRNTSRLRQLQQRPQLKVLNGHAPPRDPVAVNDRSGHAFCLVSLPLLVAEFRHVVCLSGPDAEMHEVLLLRHELSGSNDDREFTIKAWAHAGMHTCTCMLICANTHKHMYICT